MNEPVVSSNGVPIPSAAKAMSTTATRPRSFLASATARGAAAGRGTAVAGGATTGGATTAAATPAGATTTGALATTTAAGAAAGWRPDDRMATVLTIRTAAPASSQLPFLRRSSGIA